MSSSTYFISSRAPSACSCAASRLGSFDADLENRGGRRAHAHADALAMVNHPDATKQSGIKTGTLQDNTPIVKRFNLLPIRSRVGLGQRRSFTTTPSQNMATRPNAQLHKNGHPLYHCHAFRKLATTNTASLSDADMSKLLLDAGLGDGMLSARASNEGGTKRTTAPAMNITIRLSSDYATLRKLGCSDDTLTTLHGIDPPEQEVEIAAETVESGDMTLLFAQPEHKLQAAPARHFPPHAAHNSPSQSSKDNLLTAPAASARASPTFSLLKQQPARHTACGGSAPPQVDWSAEVRNSPLKFSAMTSPPPRFGQEKAESSSPSNDSKLGIQDWTCQLQGCSYSYRSVFTGPPRFPEVMRDIVTPPLLQAVARAHDRRSCTAQHKQEREPNSMLESRICAALAKESQAPTTTERMGLRSVEDRAAALEVDQIGSHYGAKDHERIRSKQDRLMEVRRCVGGAVACNAVYRLWHREHVGTL